MAIVTTRDSGKKWIRARVTGTLTLAETIDFLRTARADVDVRMWPLLVDARGCPTTMAEDEVDQAVAIVRAAVSEGQQRGHVALVADRDDLYQWFLLYEARCAEVGVRIIRVFRKEPDAARWLEIVSAARHFSGDQGID